MKSNCHSCKLCLVDTGYLCRHIKTRQNRIKKAEKPPSQQTGTLYLYGYPVKSGPFALLQFLKQEYKRKGFSENSLKISY